MSDDLRMRLSCFAPSQLGLFVEALEAKGIGIPTLGLHAVGNTAPLPFAVGKRIIDATAALDPTGHLAVRLGQRTDLLPPSFLSVAVRTSPQLQTALHTFTRFYMQRVCVFQLALVPARDGMRLKITPRLALSAATSFLMTQMLIALRGMLQQLVAQPLEGLRLELANKDIEHPAVLRALHPHTQTHAAQTGLWLSQRLLDTPCVHASPDEHAQALLACEDQLRTFQAPVRATSLIRQILDTADFRSLSEESVTALLGLSRRTLVRLLNAEGTTYRALLGEVRKQRAFKLLQQRSLTVADVAHKLGYTSPSNFARAFHRWHGMTPLQMRAQIRRS